jgi:hypothetical protein
MFYATVILAFILALWVVPVFGVLLCAAGYALGGPIGALAGLVIGCVVSAWGAGRYVRLPRE